MTPSLKRPDPATGTGRRVLRHLKVRLGLAIFVLLLAGAAAHPLLQATIWNGQESIYGPETGHDRDLEHPTGPSAAHPLGTDALGRDVLSTLTFSLAPALQVTVLAALLVGLLSIAVGSLAAYFRGWVDLAVTSVGDAFSLLPPAIALLSGGGRQARLRHDRRRAVVRFALRSRPGRPRDPIKGTVSHREAFHRCRSHRRLGIRADHREPRCCPTSFPTPGSR